jgi:RimJ/RimL family protein N-acetyltransferase
MTTPDPGYTALETARLHIRRFRLADAPVVHAYRTDPEVARYQGWDPSRFSLANAEAFVREMAHATPGTPGEWFQFALEVRSSGVVIGDVALGADAHGPETAELGFSLDRGHHGHGYATEAVRAVVAYAEGTLDATRIVAIADARNGTSIAVLERAGFARTRVEETTFKGELIREVWFERSAGP